MDTCQLACQFDCQAEPVQPRSMVRGDAVSRQVQRAEKGGTGMLWKGMLLCVQGVNQKANLLECGGCRDGSLLAFSMAKNEQQCSIENREAWNDC